MNIPGGQVGHVSTILAFVFPLSPEMLTICLQRGFVLGFGPKGVHLNLKHEWVLLFFLYRYSFDLY